MEVSKYFFSQKNFSNLLKILCKELNTGQSSKSREACKEFLSVQMNLVFTKNKQKVARGNPQVMLNSLNKKTLEQCIKKYKSRYEMSNMDRDNNLYGKRQVKIPTRPESVSKKHNNDGGNYNENNDIMKTYSACPSS